MKLTDIQATAILKHCIENGYYIGLGEDMDQLPADPQKRIQDAETLLELAKSANYSPVLRIANELR
jgi:hypothetical protein